MPVEGRCNCAGIKVKLAEMPSASAICYCSNCRRSSAGLCSVNYVLDWSKFEVEDPKSLLKVYHDNDTTSGNTITRHFCGNCGSPLYSVTPAIPGAVLKGGLFDETAQPAFESYAEEKVPWVTFDKQDAKL